MLCVATLRALDVKLAFPALTGTVASGVVPSLKVTLPLGLPAPGAPTLTVAVNVTACPNTDGLAEELRVVLVAALFTTWFSASLLEAKLTSPP